MNAPPLSERTAAHLSRPTGDYMSRDLVELRRMERLREEGRLSRILRFDVGGNTDGFSPLARDLFDSGYLARMLETYLRDYPDNQYELLRRALGRRFGTRPEWFVLSAGLESMIDHLCRAFLDPGDTVLIPVPNFCIYEDYSARQGARVLFLPLRSPGAFSDDDVEHVVEELETTRPRLLWISNPVNPPGCLLPEAGLAAIVSAAGRTGTVVVVDEAYGEYADADDAPRSAAALVASSPHLIVLRTFSKIYGLPSLRVGYLLSSSEDVRRGVLAYRPTFPFSWFSLYTCQLALLDDDWLAEARANLARRKPIVEAGLDALRAYERLPSRTNTLMFRNPALPASAVQSALADEGVLVANLGGVTGIEGQEWLRMTVRCEEDDEVFLAACARAARPAAPAGPAGG